MATQTNFDELNKLQSSDETVKGKAIDYEQYFGEMELTDEQKEKRIALAKSLDDVFFFLFALINSELALGNELDAIYLISLTDNRLRDVLSEFGIDKLGAYAYLSAYITKAVEDIVNATIKNKEDKYFTSDDRAKYIAENEANSIENYIELQEAIDNGFTKKMWVTMRDRKVRHSHTIVGGEVIGIYDTFKVGVSEMLAPKILISGQDKECINCRCSLKYQK